MASMEHITSPAFSWTEAQILELYDKLHELQLELALLKTHQEYISNESPRVNAAEVGAMQIHLLEAKAGLSLRNDVLKSVMSVQPFLRAIHNATYASPIERDLLPYIQQRETAVVEAAMHSYNSKQALGRLTELEVEVRQISHQNVDLAAKVLRLAEKTRQNETTVVNNVRLRKEMVGLEHELKTSRQRWKVMKGTASSIVAGSGIDWVRNEQLRDMVLDSAD
ncbi:centromere protein H (CENP-H)-domain-containing protein [Lasiosphaeris hirsuta]|uniref:Centromere protein H (CENP-H)-domain-containing protein n=1 Tax=Lasiosphaeris hirsuta TaxID=260670 RepID=A0AA40BAS2_9PEZI|nr:centromere protein H (CENP-H)-domain-containing protein [Lasiosphaeris hirsuta]